MSFDLNTAIDTQQRLVTSLQAKASNGIEGATAELASAIAGLRDLQAMANKPNNVAPTSPQPGYQIR